MFDEDFHNTLRMARESLGITQVQVAQALGVTRAAVGQWEKGITKPSLGKMNLLLKILELDERVREVKPTVLSHRATFSLFAGRHRLPKEPYDVPVNTMMIDEIGTCLVHSGNIDFIYRPDYLKLDKSAYGLSILSEALYPRFEIGEKIYVSRSEAPEVGDYAVITMMDESGSDVIYLRRISAIIDNLVQTEVFRPAAYTATPKSSIKSMHRVLPWHELLSLRRRDPQKES